MVAVLIRMRVAMLRNSMTGMQAVTLGLGVATGLLLAAAGAWLALHGRADLLALLLALWGAGWLVGPVFLGGAGDAPFQQVFAALPLRRRTLAGGLLAAAFIGAGPLVTIAAFAAGVVYAARYGGVAVVVAVLAMLLQVAVVVAASRVMVGLIGATVTSAARAVVSALPWAVIGAFVAHSWMFLPILSDATGLTGPVATALRVLPTGWGLVAIDAAGRADWPFVALPVAGLLILLAGLTAAWAALFTRGAVSRSAPGPARVRWGFGRTPLSAVVGRELRTSARDLHRAMFLAFAVCFAVAFAALPVLAGNTGYLAGAGLLVAVLATSGSAQLYSGDGTALWLTLMTAGSERTDVRGRQLAWLLVVAPIAVVATAAGVLLSGASWTWPWALSLLPAALGGGAGLIVAVSARLLVPAGDPRTRGRGAAGGDGTAGVVAWVILPLSMATVAPAAVLPAIGTLTGSTAVSWAGVPVGIALGIGLFRLLGRLAERRLREHGPEMLELIRSGRRRPPAAAARPRGARMWILSALSAVLLIPQGVVALMLALTEAGVRGWFLALHLPDDLRIPGAVACMLAGVAAAVVARRS